MLRLAAGAFLICHGLVHLLYVTPKPEDPKFPFVPERTWFATAAHLGVTAAKALFVSLAVAVVLAFAISGVALFVNASWWQPMALVGSAISLAVLLLGFHPWLAFGVAIDVAILASVFSAHWPAALFE